METRSYKNISLATVGSLRDLLSHGRPVDTRGASVKELRSRVTILERPEERCLFVPKRRNNVVTSLTETLWVLAGRDDVHWLETYLPRAKQFSDDGHTWRAAYGPRLRSWNGVDQLSEVLKLIRNEQSTRRAAMSLFDPALDYVSSKDIPCTNWLHWLCRDGQIHMTVGIRSNDVIWGFSGINSFEWSVLQSYMAVWSGLDVGEVTYLAPSFHLYGRHFKRAQNIVSSFRGITCYQFGLAPTKVTTAFEDFDDALENWFSMEDRVRRDPEASVLNLQDPFLAASLDLVRIRHGVARKWTDRRIATQINEMADNDLAAAGCELFSRDRPGVLDHVTSGRITDFMLAFLGQKTHDIDRGLVLSRITELHARKDSVYGISWKKRGELTSILANVARKVDRLVEFERNALELSDESALDTAVDLFVYVLKYRLYLVERELSELAAEGLAAFATSNTVLSENVKAFDYIALRYGEKPLPRILASQAISQIESRFEAIHSSAVNGEPALSRLSTVRELADLAFGLVMDLEKGRPGLIDGLLTS